MSLKRLQVGRRYPSSTSASALTGLGEQGLSLLKLLHSNPREQEGRICFALSLSHLLLLGVWSAALKGTFSDFIPWFCVTLGFLCFSSPCSAPYSITLFYEIHRASIGILYLDLWCDFSFLPSISIRFPRKTRSPGMEMAKKRKRGKKIKYWTFIGGRVCVLQRSSAIHFENILLVERITVVVVATGGVGGLLTSKRPLSLQAIFNWTLIRHLPGSSSFWSWRRSWQQRACLKARGRLVRVLTLRFNPSVDGERERYSLPLFLTCRATIYHCWLWLLKGLPRYP